MLVLEEEEVERLLDLTELSQALEHALIEFSAGRVIQPVRGIVHVPQHEALFSLMPAVYGEVMGAKLVTVFPGNASRGLPTHNAIIQLLKTQTGEPLAVVGGRVITSWRTAVVSALATRELSRADARALAILGSGVQARTHFRALQAVRSFADIRVWSRTPEHAAEFAQEIGGQTMTAEEAVRGADVIVTATHSPTPVLEAKWLKRGTHINAIGSVGAERRELGEDIMRQAAVIVESRESAVREAGEILQSGASIYAELGEILSGAKPKPESGVTVYKGLGIGVEDIAAAKLIYEKKIRIMKAVTP